MFWFTSMYILHHIQNLWLPQLQFHLATQGSDHFKVAQWTWRERLE